MKPEPQEKTKRILFAEGPGGVVMLDILVSVLRTAGYEAVGFDSFKEAARSLPSIQPDLVFLHLRSRYLHDPVMSGLDLIRCAKKWNPSGPIIVVTGALTAALIKPTVEAGATHVCMIGNLHIEDITGTIARALLGNVDPKPYVRGWGFDGGWSA